MGGLPNDRSSLDLGRRSMKVYVDSVVNPHPLAGTVRQLAVGAARHQLAATPEDADLLLLCGPFALHPERLLGHRLFQQFRSKCAVYTEDDLYCPLAPGVYTSPRRGLSTLVGRVRSYAFATSYGPHANEGVRRAHETRDVGRHSERDLLFSFEGTMSSRLRRRLVRLDVDQKEGLIRDTSALYSHFNHGRPDRKVGQLRYVETMKRSNFVLCPRGIGTGTLRLFEAMSLGVAPVLLSDRYVLPRGPAWGTFLVHLPERRLSSLPAALRSRVAKSEEFGLRARTAWAEWFSGDVLFDHLVDAASEAMRDGARTEALFRLSVPLQVAIFRFRRAAHRQISYITTRALRGRWLGLRRGRPLSGRQRPRGG